MKPTKSLLLLGLAGWAVPAAASIPPSVEQPPVMAEVTRAPAGAQPRGAMLAAKKATKKAAPKKKLDAPEKSPVVEQEKAPTQRASPVQPEKK